MDSVQKLGAQASLQKTFLCAVPPPGGVAHIAGSVPYKAESLDGPSPPQITPPKGTRRSLTTTLRLRHTSAVLQQRWGGGLG